jgi:DNA ligase-1
VKAFATLLDRLSFEPRRLDKIALLVRYLRQSPDPERGFALAALCGELDLPTAKPALLKALIAERVDAKLFALSYDFVGDLSETIALLWPAPAQENEPPQLAYAIETLLAASRRDVPGLLAGWLDMLDETGRWALLKLVTGGLRVGVSALLARQALADAFGREIGAIEEIWHGQKAPYLAMFAWLEGRAGPPEPEERLQFRAPMLAHPLEGPDFETLDPAEFQAEWKWDGIRVQAVSGTLAEFRLFSRSGDDITASFPDLAGALPPGFALDGELVIRREGQIASFSDLQQRLNRKNVTGALMAEYPAHIIAYDILADDGRDWRPETLFLRRQRLEALLTQHQGERLSLSPLIPFKTWQELAEERAYSAREPAIEGVMLKRRQSPYLAGRPKGHWFKWKRDAMLIDCVMMYAQRGHGKRSSYYSDYTFGLWDGDRLVPVGKAYFGFSDAELRELDRFVRQNTINRFGPVREVRHETEDGLVLEIAFEGVQESTRHRSGLAMRFPRIHRIRRDKRPGEADRLEALRAKLGGR